MTVRTPLILLLSTSLVGCFQIGRTNARIEEGFDVAVAISRDYYTPVTDADRTNTTDWSASFGLKLQYGGHFQDGGALAIQANPLWPALDLYYAFEEYEGDRWFFGIGAEGGAWGETFGAGLYGVATYYLDKYLYVTFTPRVHVSDEDIGVSESVQERPHKKVFWFNPQLALGVLAAEYVDLSVFLGYARLTGEGYSKFVEAGRDEDYRKRIWMMGGEARF